MKKIILCGAFIQALSAAASAQVVVYSEDFQSGIPSDWTIVVQDTSTVDPSVADFAPGWIAIADPENTADTVAGATSYFTVAAAADRWLITPAVTLNAYGNFIRWQGRSHDPSYLDGYYVLVSSTDTQISSFTDTVSIHAFENADWTEHEVNLSAEGYDNATIHVAFVLRSYDAFKLYLDDIEFRTEDPVGIEEQTAAQVVLYPNPVSAGLTIKGNDVLRVRITGTNGQTIIDQAVVSGQSVDLEMLESGAYLAAITTGSGTVYRRFIKR